MAYDCVVLADAVLHADGSQPSREIAVPRSPRFGRLSRRGGTGYRQGAPPIGQVLQDNGYSTFWLGKNHNVPEEDVSSGVASPSGPCKRASTASTGSSVAKRTTGIRIWSRTTSSSNSPTAPEDGYHLSKDLADQALKMLRDQQATNPSRTSFVLVSAYSAGLMRSGGSRQNHMYQGLDGWCLLIAQHLQRLVGEILRQVIAVSGAVGLFR